ncbi:hypothetical protein B7P43_G09760 [Cryptotermes secundus]|uniref:Tc1-like transposase DDE domain-containing protein n=1 Tax=Cryptotermes secundus TaxID=105785 RepID=A0A2J7RH44_9NEOP|nr:hypothetical protein B7P43_G09760 [Cryptotermes secundus]
MSQFEQRANFKFMCKLGKSASETLSALQQVYNIPVITQPPYSPDLAPSDFWLFPTLTMDLKGTRFATREDIKSNATAEPSTAVSTTAGSMEQVCARKGPTLKVIK